MTPTWNYRIVRDGSEYTIREVYYDEAGKIVSWTGPIYPTGESWQKVCDDHAKMGRACGQSIVDVTSGEPVQVSLRDLHRARMLGQALDAAAQATKEAEDG